METNHFEFIKSPNVVFFRWRGHDWDLIMGPLGHAYKNGNELNQPTV